MNSIAHPQFLVHLVYYSAVVTVSPLLAGEIETNMTICTIDSSAGEKVIVEVTQDYANAITGCYSDLSTQDWISIPVSGVFVAGEGLNEYSICGNSETERDFGPFSETNTRGTTGYKTFIQNITLIKLD